MVWIKCQPENFSVIIYNYNILILTTVAYKHYRRSEIPYNKNKNYVPTHKLVDSHRNRMKTWKQFVCIFYPMILNSPSVPPYFELLSKPIMHNILIYTYYVMYIIWISCCGLYRVFRSKRDNKFPFHTFFQSTFISIELCTCHAVLSLNRQMHVNAFTVHSYVMHSTR